MLTSVKPRDLDISSYLNGSGLGKGYETIIREMVATCIIKACRNWGNQWFGFTVGQCSDLENLDNKLTGRILDEFVSEGLLVQKDDKYFVQDAFIEKLQGFVR
jgi:hypothetical protein